MARLTILSSMLALALACDRGPSPPPEEEAVPAHAPSGAHAELQPPPGHGAGAHEAAGVAPRVDPSAPQLAGMRWTANDPLTWRAPSRPMRNAEYVVGEGDDEAELTIFHFPGMGGSIEENIQRWTAQFKTADGAPVDDAETEQRTIAGLEVTTVDVSGTFASSMGMGGGEPVADSRLLGAIVQAPDGPVFFKLLGPADTVASAEAAFAALVESFEPAR